MKNTAILLMLLLGTTTSYAQDFNPLHYQSDGTQSTGSVQVVNNNDIASPIPEIIGGDKPIKYGKIVKLSVKPLDPKPTNLIATTYLWRTHPDESDIFAWPDNTTIAFGVGTADNTIEVELIACYLFISKDDNGNQQASQKVSVVTKNIVVGNGEQPSPAPTPTPTPDVVDKFGLSPLISNWYATIPLDLSVKRVNAIALSASMRNIASNIRNDSKQNPPVIWKPEDIVSRTVKSNQMSIPDASQTMAWKMSFFTNLNAKLKELVATGGLTAAIDYADAWDVIANSLLKQGN